MTIAHFFGATATASAYQTAAFVPRQVYDLLVGGMISSALVPVLSEHAERNRQSFWQIASLILSLVGLVVGVAVLLAELAAPQIAILLGAEAHLDLALVTRLLRITIPAMFFLSLSGILTGLLHGLKRFTYPAFTAAAFNAAIVLFTLVGVIAFNLGIDVVAFGLVAGSMVQVAIQLPGLRGAKLHFKIDWRHPALRQIGRLYQPIVLGLVVTLVQTSLDRRWANGTGESSVAWMNNATTLIQFPMGLVAVAISLATLPTLSRYASQALRGDTSGQAARQFIRTLSSGLKIVLILIIPATVFLYVMADPVIGLVFEHGDFTPFDTAQTVLALRLYLIGLIFAAVDQPLIFAFYARQNTFTPAMVGIVSVGIYLLAVWLSQLVHPLQMTDLVLADSIKHIGHVLIMLWLISRFSSLRGQGLITTLLKAGTAGLFMGGVLWAVLYWLEPTLPDTILLNELTLVGVAALVGSLTYFTIIWLMRVEELALLVDLVRRKTGRS
jgi:putative peptidoglycan lipid II flippase